MSRTAPRRALAVLLAASFLPGSAAAAQVSPAEPAREEIEKFLRDAEVVERDRLPVGVTRSHRLTLSDGSRTMRAVWKTIDDHQPLKRFYDGGPPEIGFRDSYKSELAAYELDKLLGLGMVPPTVERRLGRRPGSLQLWIDGCITEGERRKREIVPPDSRAWGAQVYKYRLFHQLVHDNDYKNASNLLVDEKTFRIWVIDQSRAFRTQGQLLEKGYLRRFSRALLERLRGLEGEELQAKLGRWLTRGQLRGLLARRDLLVAHADALIAERGEEAILY